MQLSRWNARGLAAIVLVAVVSAPLPASAQADYPNRPIRLVAPSPPAGVHDVVGRLWAERVKSVLGTIVVENRPGAGTLIGASDVVKAEADGYTLLLGSTSSHIIAPVIAAHAPYDPLKDLRPIAVITASYTSIAVTPSLPVRTLRELIEHAKANPGKLSYGSAGVGSMSQMTGELFKTLAGGLDIVHVPYKGAGPGIADLISGHIPILTPNATGQVLDLHKSGKIRVLAVNADARLKGAPEIPTAIEAGLPDMRVLFFCGLFAPAATPRAIVDRINQATQLVLRDETFQARLRQLGYEPMLDQGPEQSERFIKEEQARWTPIVRASGAKLE
jgi:tripartite-type tricarboxylate transporter receptor subunit TctC